MGDELVLDIGPVAHGGHFVARVGGEPGGRVVFVRHALSGERVRARVVEDAGSFLRADAVAVLQASPDRVTPPCPLAHPDGCGGCDFQHVALPAQRASKTAVLREQLRRLAGIESEVEVEEVPPTLRWRTRMTYVPAAPGNGLPPGTHGLRKHRSHEVVEVADCLIAAPDARDTAAGTGTVTERVIAAGRSHSFRVAADGFWQVHVAAPRLLVETVLGLAEVRPGERVLDLYAGVGLFAAFLADEVGRGGSVTAIESDRIACRHARENLPRWVVVRQGRVDREIGRVTAADVVVLDPPRAGAKRPVVDAVAGLAPRAVVYVACDPAALARDVALFAGRGYRLAELRAFDLFPMTHHLECVALLTNTRSDLQ